jgi:hypothetical protein
MGVFQAGCRSVFQSLLPAGSFQDAPRPPLPRELGGGQAE